MSADVVAYLAGGLALVCVAGLGMLLFGGESAAAAARRRVAVEAAPARKASQSAFFFSSRPQTAVDKLKELQDEQSKSKRATMRQKLIQAGLTTGPAQFILMFQIGGVAAGAAAYVASGEALVAVAAAVVVAFLLPSMVVSKMIDRRTKKFLDLFPNAIDVLIRGVRSGMPVGESMRIIATQIEAPVGPEIGRVVAATQVGLSLEEALAQMHQRVPNQDVGFFRTVLAIQKQTGGNLADSLENLSNILRERRKMKSKIRALSSEARMSAIIIGSLPFIVGLLVYLLRPEYIGILFEDPTGHMMLGGGAIWMSIGIWMMRSMVNFEI